MSTEIPKIITGTGRKLTVHWEVNGTAAPIPATATVRFVLVSRDHDKPYTSVLTADKDHPDADWANGVIIVIFPASETVGITSFGLAWVQIEVDQGGDELVLVGHGLPL